MPHEHGDHWIRLDLRTHILIDKICRRWLAECLTAPPKMTNADADGEVVIESNIAHLVYVDENEDAGVNDSKKGADGKHVVPNGVAIEVSVLRSPQHESGTVE